MVISLIEQSEHLVKADKLLYSLRDVTATVDLIPLIASSVMSKKIAAGDKILLDVTVGQGAFMKSLEEAEHLSETMVSLGREVDRETIAVITDMSQPLGRAIGNRLEIFEAIEIMQGKGRADITEFICELAEILLNLTGVESSSDKIRQHLVEGVALSKFEELIEAQGGDLDDLYRKSAAAYVTEVLADEESYISELPALAFGKYAMKLGASRTTKADTLNYETGIVFEKKVGDSVKVSETVDNIYSDQALTEELIDEFKAYITNQQ
ncbi:pyrimidine-nucleoside phosphorylase [Streptococcus thermophilus]|nr:pyrimidine-nucleoside phosphorylase [Streptococcus thermophilus]MCE2084184.1 pyrimidine-nucleoside phosphorylase [Streptococcus thermophilus]